MLNITRCLITNYPVERLITNVTKVIKLLTKNKVNF